MPEQTTGTLIGRYQLVAPIGVGGMGRVWVAIDTASPAMRLVALKTTLNGADGGMNPDFWAVLADEAAVASRINHPNVCATHELSQEGGTHFLVMDWSDGASLRDVLNALPHKRLSPEVAAYVAACVAAGLHAAHELTDEQGHSLAVVHRDVSPQNVLVSMRGQIRLADFGVAKSRGQLHKATETGEVKGKLSYMAPEQVTSKNVDRRADIFALGCMLYESALGARPFHGADALATMYKILEEEHALPRALLPDFPQQLEAVIVKALAKDADDRFQTADEFREALVEYLSSTGRHFGDKQVKQVLDATLGPELAERNRTIVAAAARVRRGGQLSPPESPPPPRPHETLTPEGGVERTVTALHQQRRQERLRSMLVAVVALVVVAAFWRVRSQDSTPQGARVVASPIVASSAVALTGPQPVALSAEPPPASVPSTPAVAPQPAPSPAFQDPAPPGARPASPKQTTRASAPAASPHTSTPAEKANGKRPRPIDKQNIFATP